LNKAALGMWAEHAKAAFEDSADLMEEMASISGRWIAETAEILVKSLAGGGKLLTCGNGGSAADAQHIAAELAVRFKRKRKALPAIALTTNASILTAVANDLGYERVFARQIEAMGQEGDVLLALSTSGSSRNVLEAVEEAKRIGIHTVGLTGVKGGDLVEHCDRCIVVPSDVTARIQEVHMVIGHILCELVELWAVSGAEVAGGVPARRGPGHSAGRGSGGASA